MCEELTPSLIWSEAAWSQRNAAHRWISQINHNNSAALLLFRFEVMWDITVPRECMCVYKCNYEAVTDIWGHSLYCLIYITSQILNLCLTLKWFLYPEGCRHLRAWGRDSEWVGPISEKNNALWINTVVSTLTSLSKYKMTRHRIKNKKQYF